MKRVFYSDSNRGSESSYINARTRANKPKRYRMNTPKNNIRICIYIYSSVQRAEVPAAKISIAVTTATKTTTNNKLRVTHIHTQLRGL